MTATTLQLKYTARLKETTDFSSISCTPANGKGYRFVTSNLGDTNNFLPVALIQPGRVLNGGIPIESLSSGYALSMFDTLAGLMKKTRIALKASPLFLKRVGDHYAELQLSNADGICTAPAATGHYDFHEAIDFTPITVVTTHAILSL